MLKELLTPALFTKAAVQRSRRLRLAVDPSRSDLRRPALRASATILGEINTEISAGDHDDLSDLLTQARTAAIKSESSLS